MNRALRAAALGVLLFSPIALSACSSGQVSQTVEQNRDKTGPMGSVGPIELRQVQVAYPRTGTYQQGDDAALQMSIINTGTTADTLVSIAGDGFSNVYTTGTGSQATSSSAATTTGAAPTTGAASSGQLNIPIPPDSSVYLGQNAPHVYLSGLSEPLTSGQGLPLTITFEKAGTVSMRAVVAPASNLLPHTSTYNFQQAGESQGGVAGGHD